MEESAQPRGSAAAQLIDSYWMIIFLLQVRGPFVTLTT